MKKTWILVMMLTLSAAAFAQRGQRAEPPSAEERIEKATEALALSDEQVQEWQTIFEKYDGEMKAAREKKDRGLIETTREAMETELKATLSEEQTAKFEEMTKPRRRRRGN